jgi:hypothetical protein
MASEPGTEPRTQLRTERKFWTAIGLFAVLAVIIWFTAGENMVSVFGRQIEMRWIPLFVIGTFAFRAYMAREADKIRRRSQDEQ